MMTREDILRELELLPMWQLRAPLNHMARIDAIESTGDMAEDSVASESSSSVAPAPAMRDAPATYSHLESEDGAYLFLLAPVLGENETKLLQNMTLAMRIRVSEIRVSALDIEALKARVVIALGESVAQELLETEKSLAHLRGVAHPLQAAHLIVTYDLAHLLQNGSDKPNAWQDLCLAMQTHKMTTASNSLE